MVILTLVFTITAIAAVGSLIFDAIALHWHRQDRKRFECDEKREEDLERRVAEGEARINA